MDKQHISPVRLILWVTAAAICNILLNTLFERILHFPLFMDTVFTVAITFAFGTVPGLITACFTTAVLSVLRCYEPISYLYVLCSFSEVFLTAWFCRYCRNFKKDRTIILINLFLLSVLMAFIVSIIGGVINTICNLTPDFLQKTVAPTDMLELSLLRAGFPELWASILARIPTNLIDRPVTVFGSYALVQLLTRKKEL